MTSGTFSENSGQALLASTTVCKGFHSSRLEVLGDW
jgi:hypothetical protein